MGAVYKRELRSYFQNMTGPIVIAFLLVMTGIFSASLNFRQGYPNFEYNLGSLSFVLLFVIPILTMRSLSEEKKQKTDLLLYSLPLPMTSVILGKYLAMLTVYAIPIAAMCLYPLLLSFYGTVNLIGSFSGIFGFFLLGAALIAIGLFMSSLTESQVIAAVLSFGALLLCYLMSGIASMIPTTTTASLIAFLVLIFIAACLVYYLTKNTPLAVFVVFVLGLILVIAYRSDSAAFAGLFPSILKWLSLFDRLDIFAFSNIFDLTSVVYYLSISAVFVFLTVQAMDKRRWS